MNRRCGHTRLFHHFSWFGKTTFVQVCVTRALTCLEAVKQSPCVISVIEIEIRQWNQKKTRFPSNLRHDHPRGMVCGAIWRVPTKIADRSWSVHEQAFATFLCSCDLHLDLMTFLYELDPYSLEIQQTCMCEHRHDWNYIPFRFAGVNRSIANVVQCLNPCVNYCEMEFSCYIDECRLLWYYSSDALEDVRKQRSIVAASCLYVRLRNTFDSMISSSGGTADRPPVHRLSICGLALCRSV